MVAEYDESVLTRSSRSRPSRCSGDAFTKGSFLSLITWRLLLMEGTVCCA